MTDKELLQQALDYMESEVPFYESEGNEPPIGLTECIEAIKARLAQPEMINGLTEEQTDATMSVKGLTQPEPVEKMREMMELQGQDGTWNYDPYFHGMYNGMEFMLAMVEDREPVFRSSPSKWLGYTAPPKKEWVGLTDREIAKIYNDCDDWEHYEYERAIEAKLKEKNHADS